MYWSNYKQKKDLYFILGPTSSFHKAHTSDRIKKLWRELVLKPGALIYIKSVSFLNSTGTIIRLTELTMWPLIRTQDAHFLFTMESRCPMWIITSMVAAHSLTVIQLCYLQHLMGHTEVSLMGLFKSKVHKGLAKYSLQTFFSVIECTTVVLTSIQFYNFAYSTQNWMKCYLFTI